MSFARLPLAAGAEGTRLGKKGCGKTSKKTTEVQVRAVIRQGWGSAMKRGGNIHAYTQQELVRVWTRRHMGRESVKDVSHSNR